MNPSTHRRRAGPADALRDTGAAEVQWRECAFGPWAIRDLRDESFLGCAELRMTGDGIDGIEPDEVEAGWWVAEERRNQGIATEAMRAAIGDLWDRAEADGITAYIEEGANEASRGVAAKLGFAVRGTGRGRSADPMKVYELRRDAWQPGADAERPRSDRGVGQRSGCHPTRHRCEARLGVASRHGDRRCARAPLYERG